MMTEQTGRAWPLGDPTSTVRIGQLAFATLFGWKAAEASMAGADIPGATLLAVVLAFALCAVSAAVPWSRTPRWLPGALLTVDVGLIGVAALGAPGASVVVVLTPAIGFAVLHGPRAVGLAVAEVLLAVTLPTLVRHPDDLDLARALVTPLATLGAAVVAASARERILARQREVAHRSSQLAAVFDTVDVGLVLLDEHGNFTSANARQQGFIELVYPDGPPAETGRAALAFGDDGVTQLSPLDVPSARALRGEEFDNLVLWCGADPSTRRAASVSSRLVRDAEGRIGGAVLSFNDVTDLLRALQVKDEFIASVSHELRTPLTSIAGYLQVLLDDPHDLPPAAQAHLRVVARNTERLSRLVSDLLLAADQHSGSVATPDAGDPAEGDDPAQSTDLADLIRGSIETAVPLARAGRVRIELDAPYSLPARIDPEGFVQISDNLISNAVKYTPAGGLIDVTLCTDGDVARLVVSDTGIGIPPCDLDRVFGRFFRSQEAVRRAIGGVGLGLSIVDHAVDRLHGRITVDSEPGRGSRFTVHLPLACVTGPLTTTAGAAAPAAPPASTLS